MRSGALRWASLAVLVVFAGVTLGLARAEERSTEDVYNEGRYAYRSDDYTRALEILLPLAEGGHAGAQYYVGRMYEKGEGVDKDPVQTVNWYRRSADGGDPRAQYRLAVGYARGWGTLAKDETQARAWLVKAAEGGHARAQRALGHAYKRGLLGFAPDAEKARYWLELGREKDR